MTSTSKLILVTGDPICDHSYYRGNRPTADSTERPGFRFARTGGGALLLKDLILQATACEPDWRTEFGLDPDFESLPPASHAYCLWEPQVANPEEKDAKQQFKVWRAVEPPLGYGHPASESTLDDAAKVRTQAILPRSEPLPAPPEILVIDDAGLSFRDPKSKPCWPFALEGTDRPGPRWVVMKLAGAIGEGELWHEVVARCPQNLILIVSADQLRRSDVRVSRGLSWEATVEDLSAELQGNPLLKPLLAARHLIITFKSDGAFWLDNGAKSKSSLLVFDAVRAEGEWVESQGQGTVFGFLTCFTTAIVRELCRAQEDPDLESALMAGLGASRELRRLGHGRPTIKQKQPDGSEKLVDNPKPGFPFAEIAACICQPKAKFVSAVIPQRFTERSAWMMLDEWQVQARSGARQRPYFEAAQAVAVVGPGALERFPVAQFGALQTADRKEIESLRTIRQLIKAYDDGGRQKKPLSLGVFGPPGAGKSFGVTQIAVAVLGLKEEDILTFNLSQFSNPADLNGAFHRVRDRALSGRTPLVFWDEFDSQGYKWLQYLLAPMQDGAFQDGQVTHPIGKCVFVFAGATSPTFDTFGPRNPDLMPPAELAALKSDHFREVENKWLDFILKKGPDFKSRLVGYLNVLGPNPRQKCGERGGRRYWKEDPDDLCFPIRRALFIRSQFKLKDGMKLVLDPGVLRALLEIPHYKSGARSLEFLCQHLRQNGGLAASRSNLPGNQLLDMHVDAAAFWNLCERDLGFLPQAIALARGFHEDWRKNPASKGNDFNKPWEALDEPTRASNVQQALRIATNLATVDLRIEKGPPLQASQEKAVRVWIDEHLELIAEAEHNGWMVERMIAGWRYARIPEKDTKHKLHPLLLPYAQLPKAEKEKDRRPIRGFIPNAQQKQAGEELVEGYMERLKRVGYRISFTATTPQGQRPKGRIRQA